MVSSDLVQNEVYKKSDVVFGIGWKPANGAIIKADFQKVKSRLDKQWRNQINIGIG